MSKEKATLIIEVPGLHIAQVPLVDTYVDVNVYHERNGCPDFDSKKSKAGFLDYARLTAKSLSQQTVIPANEYIYLDSFSTHESSNSTSTCSTLSKFKPMDGAMYRLRFIMPDRMLRNCDSELVEVLSGPVSKEVIPDSLERGALKDKGFWKGRTLGENLCIDKQPAKNQ